MAYSAAVQKRFGYGLRRVAAAAVFCLCPLLAATQTPQVVFLQFDPPVIPREQTPSVILRASVSGAPTRVVFAQSGGPEREFRDDGFGGDAMAGDGIYTLTLATSDLLLPGTAPVGTLRPFVGFLDIYSGTTRVLRGNVIAEVYEPSIPLVPVTSLAGDVQYTPYLVNIHIPNFSFTSFEISRATQRFYELFPDAYDFVNVIWIPQRFQNRFHAASRNDVQGIGLTIFNNTASFGSAGRLLGYSNFPISSLFDGADTGYQHELGHQWINFLRFAPFEGSIPHWPVSSLASGVMGFNIPGGNVGGSFPCYLVRDSDGVRLIQRTAEPAFTDLDLYLMGFLPASQVGEVLVVTDQSQASTILSQCDGRLYTGAVEFIQGSAIIATAGTRIPDSTASPKRFKIASIIISRDGLLSPEAMAFYSFFAQRAEATSEVPYHWQLISTTRKPFAITTRGIGSLDARVASPPFGWLDAAADAADGDATIAQNGNLTVRGWAADEENGAPVSRVEIRIDDVIYGNATLGESRPDVAAALGRADFANSGWTFAVNIGTLAPGARSVQAVAFDAQGAATTLGGSRNITVVEANLPPFGWIDVAGEFPSGNLPIPYNGSLVVRGWAADNEGGAPVARVEIRIDDSLFGLAMTGLARPDVAAAFGRPEFTNSGWFYQATLTNVQPGPHTLSVVAFDSTWTAAPIGNSISFTVVNRAPLGWMDFAYDAADGDVTLGQGGNLQVSGWAADLDTGAPVSKVEILIDGLLVGLATLNGSRPDLVNAYNRSDFANSGWSFTGNISNLLPGVHAVSAVAYDAFGASALLGGSKEFLVVTNFPPFGWVDAASDSADGDNSLNLGGTLFVSGWAVDNESGAPVSRVEIRIDGNAVGNATLGAARQDIANAFGRQDFLSSGWSLAVNIGALSLGQHTVTAVAFDSVNASTTLGGAVNITVVSANTPPVGWMDEARDAADGDSTIPQNGNLLVRGWVVDNEDTAPVSRVEIRIDGNAVGNATLGAARQDIANAFGRQDFLNSGWSLAVNIGALSLGQHTVMAVAFDSGNASATLGVPINITVVTANQAPQGWMDEAKDAADGDASIPQNGNLLVRGWAVDNEMGAPVSRVEVRIDGVPVGDATLGAARQDIANAFGRQDFLNSGWSLTVNIGALSLGQHTVTAVAFDSANASASLGVPINITVVSANQAPTGWVDEAKDAADGDTTLVQGGALVVRGWAVDNEDGAPVARVELRIDGVPVGDATLGSARQDIANAFGRQDFLNSGWSLTVNIGGLSLGQHTVTAVAFDSSNASATLGVPLQFTVANTAPQGWMDEAKDAVDGDTTIPQNGNLFVRGWAVDNESGAPVSRVEVRIDGVAVGDATLAAARPDIAVAFGRPDFWFSGWSLTVNIGSLSLGQHTVTAVAFDSANASTILGGAVIITVTSP